MKNRIKEFRTEQSLTMQALAERVGTTASQINKLEKGERRLTADWMYRIADALSIPPTALFPNHDQSNTTSQKSNSDQNKNTYKNTVALPVITPAASKAEHWMVPRSFLKNKKSLPQDIDPKIIKITQQNLEPEVSEGDYVLINANDKRPSIPGIFIVKNEDNEFMMQHCKLIYQEGEEKVQFMSVEKTDAGLKKTKTIQSLQDITIEGRIIAHYHWLI